MSVRVNGPPMSTLRVTNGSDGRRMPGQFITSTIPVPSRMQTAIQDTLGHITSIPCRFKPRRESAAAYNTRRRIRVDRVSATLGPRVKREDDSENDATRSVTATPPCGGRFRRAGLCWAVRRRRGRLPHGPGTFAVAALGLVQSENEQGIGLAGIQGVDVLGDAHQRRRECGVKVGLVDQKVGELQFGR